MNSNVASEALPHKKHLPARLNCLYDLEKYQTPCLCVIKNLVQHSGI
jgi:hypothetical protein